MTAPVLCLTEAQVWTRADSFFYLPLPQFYSRDVGEREHVTHQLEVRSDRRGRGRSRMHGVFSVQFYSSSSSRRPLWRLVRCLVGLEHVENAEGRKNWGRRRGLRKLGSWRVTENRHANSRQLMIYSHSLRSNCLGTASLVCPPLYWC